MWPREENGDEIENVWLHIFTYYLWRAKRSPWWRDVDEDVKITVEFSQDGKSVGRTGPDIEDWISSSLFHAFVSFECQSSSSASTDVG